MKTTLRVLVIAFDAATLPRVVQVLEDINSINTGGNLSTQVAVAVGLQNATAILENQLFDCYVVTGNADAPSLQLLRELQAYAISAPIILVLDQVNPDATDYWSKAGIWEVLNHAELTPSLLAQTLRCVIWVRQADQQVALVNRRLRQNEQILQQAKVIKEQAQRIQQLDCQLSEASQLKSQFLATVSHELRTPMNAMIGFSQLLLRHNGGTLKTHHYNMVERILANAKHLLTIINEMLNFSKVEAGQLQLQPQSLNLAHLLRAVGQELEDVAQRKQLKLEIVTDLDNPYIVADPTCLQQVVFNLVSNALKFTSSGSVQVSTWESEDWVAIIIQDTGIGIHPNELEHIFEPFRQIDQTTTRQHRGLGMGLALTAALVQKMFGTISVDSAIGEGSTFRVELPRHGFTAAPLDHNPRTGSALIMV